MKLTEINTSRNEVGDTQVAFYFVHEGRTFAAAQCFSRHEHSYDVVQKLHRLAERIANGNDRILAVSGFGSTFAAIVETETLPITTLTKDGAEKKTVLKLKLHQMKLN